MTMKGLNANARLAMAFGAGAVLGAAGGFLLAKRLLAEQAEQRISSEVDQVREHYQSRTEDLQRAHAAALANATSKGDNPLDGETAVGDPRGGMGAQRVDYGAVSAPGNTSGDLEQVDDAGETPERAVGLTPRDQVGPDATGRTDPLEGVDGDDPDDESEDDPEDGELAADAVLADPDYPRVISADEFMENEGELTQVEMTWYAEDGALVDEREQPVRNPYELLGMKFNEHFGDQSDDDRLVYVRNPRLGVDFCVKLHDGSYVDEVLNYGKPR